MGNPSFVLTGALGWLTNEPQYAAVLVALRMLPLRVAGTAPQPWNGRAGRTQDQPESHQ